MAQSDTIQSSSNDLVEINESQINFLIKSHESSMKFYIFYALGVVTLGALVIYFSKDLTQGLDASNVAKIGGGFVSTLSLFPIKEVIKRKDKKQVLQLLIISLKQNPNSLKDNPKTQELIWKYLGDILAS